MWLSACGVGAFSSRKGVLATVATYYLRM
jgi:hypothetical protein